jgi:hypothetical protein
MCYYHLSDLKSTGSASSASIISSSIVDSNAIPSSTIYAIIVTVPTNDEISA